MSIGNLLSQTITIYNKSSYDEFGRLVLGAGIDINARVQPKSTRRLLPNGDVLTIDALTYVPADTTVNTDDKIVYGNDTYKVYGKYPTPDGKGNTAFIRLELLKWQM